MTPSQARHTLELLAQGLHPKTQALLPPSEVLDSPEVIRALFVAVRALAAAPQEAEGAPVPMRARPAKAGRPWDAAEDERLTQGFDAEQGLRELAAQHERSRNAIKARLVKLGKLSA